MQFTIDTIDNLLYINILVVGPPKNGKTQSCATLHKLRKRPYVQGTKLYIFDFDEGCQPIIRVARREGWADELRVFRFPRVGGDKIKSDEKVNRTKEPFLDFLTQINRLYDNVENGKWKDSFVNEAPYAIVIDSLTAIQDDILGFTLTLRNKELGGERVDGRQEYGMQMGKIVETVRSTRALPCFSIWLAHEQSKMGTVKMPSAPKGGDPIDPVMTGVISKLPLTTGQLANQIGGEFGAVLFTSVRTLSSTTAAYEWQTRPEGEVRMAGSRLKEGLPLYIPQDFDLVVD